MSAGGGRSGTGYVEIRPELDRGFSRDLQRQLQRQIGSGLSVDVDSKKMGRDLGRGMEAGVREHGRSVNWGAALMGGGALVAGAAIAGKEFFEAFSNQGEAVNKVNVVFGDASAEMQTFADTSAKSMGISKTATLDALGTFGNLFRAMGIGTDTAGDMSTSVLTLAADLASFNNAKPEEVLEALKAGLVGETEPLRRFGVNLNEARIRAEAFSLGLVKADVDQVKLRKSQLAVTDAQRDAQAVLKKHGRNSLEYAQAANKVSKAEQDVEKAMEGSRVELTAGQKAQAAYALIMRDTSLAQGDFARTADGAANKTRVLAATWEDTKAKLGEALAPLGNAVLGGLLSGLEGVSGWWAEKGPGIKTWIAETFGSDPAASFRNGLDLLQQKLEPFKNAAVTAWNDISGANAHSGSVLSDWHDSLILTTNDFRQGLTNGKEPMQALSDGWGIVLNKLDGAWDTIQRIGDWIRGTGDPFQAFRDGLQKIQDFLDPIWGTIQNIVSNPLVQFATGMPTTEGNGEGWEGVRKKLLGFDDGGVVPGRRGSPQVVLAHGGETILPTHKNQLGGGGQSMGGTFEGNIMLPNGEALGRFVAPIVEQNMMVSARGRKG